MYGDKTQPERLDIKGPKGQIIPKAKINLAYYVTKEEFRKMYYGDRMTYAEIIKEIEYPYDASAFSRIVRGFNWKNTKGGIPKYTVNEDYFNKWTSDSAWVLGLLITDGHVNDKSVDLTLQSRDVDVLNKVKDSIDFSGDLYIREGHNTLRVYNRNLVKSVRSVGIPKKDKTHSVEFPKIPHEYRWDFIRGVFEGDGNISTHKWNLSTQICGASSDFMEGLNRFLNEEGIETRFNKRKSDGFIVIEPNSMKGKLKMLGEIYDNSSEDIRMNRKYNSYVEFLKNFYIKERKCDEAKRLVDASIKTILKEAV